MGLNLTCPPCDKRMTMDFSTTTVSCQHCGYVRPDEIAHLEEVTHLEALRMLMVLNGRLTPEQAAQTYHDGDQKVWQAAELVTAKATELLCPNCGGDLTVDDEAHRVECRFCGYSKPQESQHAGH